MADKPNDNRKETTERKPDERSFWERHPMLTWGAVHGGAVFGAHAVEKGIGWAAEKLSAKAAEEVAEKGARKAAAFARSITKSLFGG